MEEQKHSSRPPPERHRQNKMRARGRAHCWIWFSVYTKSYSISYNPFWMYKGWSSQMLASLYNSLFVLAVLEIIDISLASGKWALLNSQIQKYVWICFLGELSTIVFYNSKEPGGGKWFLPRSIISDLARTRLDRREGGKFLSHCLEHLSDAK